MSINLTTCCDFKFHLVKMTCQRVVFHLDRKTIQEQNSGSGLSTWFRLYCIPLIFYGGSELFIWLFLNMPGLRILAASCSNFGPTRFLKWVHQVHICVQFSSVFSCGMVAVQSKLEL